LPGCHLGDGRLGDRAYQAHNMTPETGRTSENSCSTHFGE
jgi:hypothetical protein